MAQLGPQKPMAPPSAQGRRVAPVETLPKNKQIVFQTRQLKADHGPTHYLDARLGVTAHQDLAAQTLKGFNMFRSEDKGDKVDRGLGKERSRGNSLEHITGDSATVSPKTPLPLTKSKLVDSKDLKGSSETRKSAVIAKN